MALPPDLLLRSPAEGSRRIALELLEAAAAALERLRDPQDLLALHDFRVALRRLRSTLRAWRPELADSVGGKQRKALAKLQEMTSGGRDAEVGLEWLAQQSKNLTPRQRSGWAWINSHLKERLLVSSSGAHNEVRREFEALYGPLRERLARLRSEIHLLRPAPPQAFGRVLATRLLEHSSELVERLQFVTSFACRQEAHTARIRLKRLRYLIDPTADLHVGTATALAQCKELQSLLGDLNDTHVMRELLTEALAQTALAVAQAPASALLPASTAALAPLPTQTGRPPVERAKAAREHAGLSELLRRATKRGERLYGKLERDWLSSRAAPLVAAVEIASTAAKVAARAALEIERKFLLRSRPKLPVGTPSQRIDQGWLPGSELLERVRRVRDKGCVQYLRTIKFGKGLQRTEIEEPTSRQVFDGLWPLTEGRRVSKRRYKVADGQLTWEIDKFQDRELWLAEVELPDADTLATPPAWLAPSIVREVTDEDGFTNYELAR